MANTGQEHETAARATRQPRPLTSGCSGSIKADLLYLSVCMARSIHFLVPIVFVWDWYFCWPKHSLCFSYPAIQMGTSFHSCILKSHRIAGAWHLNSCVLDGLGALCCAVINFYRWLFATYLLFRWLVFGLVIGMMSLHTMPLWHVCLSDGGWRRGERSDPRSKQRRDKPVRELQGYTRS
jgi:hypothetical protein